MLLIAPWVFLLRADAGASPGPPVTCNNTPRPVPTQPPPPITQYAPPANALVALESLRRASTPSTAEPALGCTYTKRVPRPRTASPRNPNNHPQNNQPTDTLTSYVNCRGCTAATAITVPHIPARAAGPAWRLPFAWSTPTPSPGGTTTVYRCIQKPSATTSSSTSAIGGSGRRRTRPVEKTPVFDS